MPLPRSQAKQSQSQSGLGRSRDPWRMQWSRLARRGRTPPMSPQWSSGHVSLSQNGDQALHMAVPHPLSMGQTPRPSPLQVATAQRCLPEGLMGWKPHIPRHSSGVPALWASLPPGGPSQRPLGLPRSLATFLTWPGGSPFWCRPPSLLLLCSSGNSLAILPPKRRVPVPGRCLLCAVARSFSMLGWERVPHTASGMGHGCAKAVALGLL